jgi:hypothetical protein
VDRLFRNGNDQSWIRRPVKRLSVHAKALGTDAIALRIGVIHTYASDLLANRAPSAR